MNTDIGFPEPMGSPSPGMTPNYGVTPTAETVGTARKTRCQTGIQFFTSLYGILNIALVVALVCVLISAGVFTRPDAVILDRSSNFTNVGVSAVHTRGADLGFAVIGLVFIIVDTVLHTTGFINRLPSIFDLIFIIVMFVLAGIYLILGCCSSAWAKKITDVKPYVMIKNSGSAGAAAFFIFASMFLVVINFALRLIRPTGNTPR